jgi:hypothetical protein
MYPADLKYTKDHEWIRTSADTADVGITDFAQQQLGDVVFVELPQVGRVLAQGEVFGTIESVKAVSELFSPVAGEVRPSRSTAIPTRRGSSACVQPMWPTSTACSTLRRTSSTSAEHPFDAGHGRRARFGRP